MQSEAKSNRVLAELIESYDVKCWLLWIDDILIHGVAKPVTSFSEDGDVLKEMFDFFT
mgnify:FL=1